MTAHSVAETKNKLSELIDRAIKGEDVIITRHGQPVARISGLQASGPKPITDASIDWLERNLKGLVPLKEDGGALMRKIRDDEPE